MDLPENPSINYVVLLLFLIGLFLFIAGLDLIRIEKITVRKGVKTWVVGLVLMVFSAATGLANWQNKHTATAPAPVTSTSAILPITPPTKQPIPYETSSPPEKTAPDSPKAATTPLVKYKQLNQGEWLYTRGCSSASKTSWINRFQVVRIDNNGTGWGTFEKASITNPNFKTVNYRKVDASRNLSDICRTGGCYTRESAAIADVKRWMFTQCPW